MPEPVFRQRAGAELGAAGEGEGAPDPLAEASEVATLFSSAQASDRSR